MKHLAGYALCPRCWRAVPVQLGERYCVNDGTPLLLTCSRCGRAIHSPYARYCASCGRPFDGPSAASPSL